MADTLAHRISVGLEFTPTHRTAPTPSTDPTLHSFPPNFTVLITGASKGIGAAIVRGFARAGATNIAIVARNEKELSELSNELCHAVGEDRRIAFLIFAKDVSDKEAVREIAEEVERVWGRLDVVVNNAGYLPPAAKIADDDPDLHWKAFETNVKGPYLFCHYLLPLMLKSPNGRKTIINLGSWGIVNPSRQGAAAYYTSKTALARFTEFLDIEYGAEGLIAVTLHPGGCLTDMTKESPENLQRWLVDSLDLPAGVCVWLSKESRPWLSGRYVSSNWDVDELEAKKDDILEKNLLRPKYRFE